MESIGFPPQILDGSNALIQTNSLQGPFGIYFSAHWCPPCRGFTPVLNQWYQNFHEKNPGKPFSIVFVSSDRSQTEFDDYRKEMNFHALPFSEREVKAKLSSKFGVKGIPTFLLFDTEGNIVNKNGRDIVSSDPDGLQYPWVPKPFAEAVQGPLLGHGGVDVEFASLTGKYIAFYFSAHWCGPCRGFTPDLVKAYTALAGNPFEIVFASSDSTEEEFQEYFGTMPWLAFPYEDPRIEYLNSLFEVEGIPTLVLVGPNGQVLRTDLREVIGQDLDGKNFPWPKTALNTLSGSMGDINDKPTLVIFGDGSDEQVDAAKQALMPAATAEDSWAHTNNAEHRVHFAYVTKNDMQSSASVLRFLKLGPKDQAFAVFIDVANSLKYVAEGDLTSAEVTRIVEGLHNKTLLWVPLK